MTARRVTEASQNAHGYIIRLGNPDEAWSPRSAKDVVLDIELGINTYYVQWPERRSQIRNVKDLGGTYLRADRDDRTRNDLWDLPRRANGAGGRISRYAFRRLNRVMAQPRSAKIRPAPIAKKATPKDTTEVNSEALKNDASITVARIGSSWSSSA